MLEPGGKEGMLKLAESHTVGVWMLKPRYPGALSVAKRVVERRENVAYHISTLTRTVIYLLVMENGLCVPLYLFELFSRNLQSYLPIYL